MVKIPQRQIILSLCRRPISFFSFLWVMTGFLGCSSNIGTKVSIQDKRWFINEELVHKGSPAEGLLMNVRMVNAVFEDLGPVGKTIIPEFDPEENTNRFIKKLPEYVAHGVRAFTISLQGGMPGYEGAINSAFNADGSLREDYLDRVEKVILAADQEGAVIILSCFYQRQHFHERALKGKQAVLNAVGNISEWIKERKFTNVVMEISNEYAHNGYNKWQEGEWLKSVPGQVELIQHAKSVYPRLLVSAGGMGRGDIDATIAHASDFILIHFNNTPMDQIPGRIAQALSFGKPVICNEDVKTGEEGAEAAYLSVKSGAGWGLMLIDKNQAVPFEFDGAADDPLVYNMISRITKSGETLESLAPVPSTMVFPKANWQETSPENQGIDPKKLEEAVTYLKNNSGSDGVKELVIIRNGHMIWKGPEIDKVHNVWSLTKSITGTALGLLIEDGKISLDSHASLFLPELSRNYSEVNLRHFTTMTSGYTAVGDNPEEEGASHGQSSTPLLPAKPLFHPGSRFAYWDSAMNMFASLLSRIAGESLEQLFKRRIADPIGMDSDLWEWKAWDDKETLRINGGAGNQGKGIYISASALSRFGHLFLNQGKWENRQLLDSEWITEATKSQVSASLPLGHPSGNAGPGQYGYNWWTNGIDSEGLRKWPDAPSGTYSASGFNNNDMFVIPEWNMVIVRLGLDQNEVLITDAVYNNFLLKVGQSIM